MSGGTGIRARLRTWYRQRFVSSSLTSCTNDSIAKQVKAAVCKTAIICSNQIGVSKCTSGGTGIRAGLKTRYLRYVGSIPTLRTQNGAVLKWLKRPVLKTGRRETVRRFKSYQLRQYGQVAEWSKAADCKSAGETLQWFKSTLAHHTRSSFCQSRQKLFHLSY